jgi:DNA-directed RNA polymerase subunit D
MEIKKLCQEEKKLELLVKGTDTPFMNAIRRTAMNNTPVLAIENISIYENNSIMFDELLASRLALIPLKSETPIKKGDKIKMILEEEGPKTVYSKNIKSTDPTIDVVHEQIPIVKLKEKQKIKMEMYAVAGTGKEHAKWQPGNTYFQNTITLTAKKGINTIHEKIVEKNKDKILEVKDKKITLTDPLAYDLSKKTSEEITTEYNPNQFILTVEGYGQYSEEKEILFEATKTLKEKTQELKKELKKLKEQKKI